MSYAVSKCALSPITYMNKLRIYIFSWITSGMFSGPALGQLWQRTVDRPALGQLLPTIILPTMSQCWTNYFRLPMLSQRWTNHIRLPMLSQSWTNRFRLPMLSQCWARWTFQHLANRGFQC